MQRSKGTPKTKRYSVIDNFSSKAEFIVLNASVDNLARAVNERMMMPKLEGKYQVPFKPDNRSLKRLSGTIRKSIRSHIRKVSPYPRERIPELYTGRKRTIYQNALNSLQIKPLDKKDWQTKIFGKIENLKLSGKDEESIIQRVIQGQSTRYNVELACYIKPMEHLLYRAIDDMFNARTGASDKEKTVLKGLNCQQVAEQIKMKWDRFADPVCLPIDAKKFDACTSNKIQRVEHSIYGMFFDCKEDKKKLSWLLSKQLKVKGRGICHDGTVKYQMENIRMSGCMNTGSGNCSVMCYMIFEFMDIIGISHFAVGDNGDDAFIIVERHAIKKVMDNLYTQFKCFGYIMEIGELAYDMEEIEFCQTHPVFDGESWRMVRDPRNSCTKDTISIHPFNSVKDYCAYLDSVGTGGLSATGGIPMLQDFYSAMIRLSESNAPEGFDVSKRKIEQTQQVNGFYYMRRGMNKKHVTITDQARVSFWKAFGIKPDVQLFMEAEYRSISQKWQGPAVPGPINRSVFHLV